MPAARRSRSNLNRRVSDMQTPAPGNTLRPHDLELRRLQGESQALTKELDVAHSQITNLQNQLILATGKQAANSAEFVGADSAAVNSRSTESFADPENA